MSGDTTVTVIGNICSEPDLKFLPNGTAVVNTTVASTPRSWDKAAGEFKDGEPLFLRLNIWREMAENSAETLAKGARVIVVGRLKQRSYEKDGQKRTSVELEVDEIGPSLRYAQAKVSKVSKSGGGNTSQPAADPWGSNDSAAPF